MFKRLRDWFGLQNRKREIRKRKKNERHLDWYDGRFIGREERK